jgi:hypothetical protein
VCFPFRPASRRLGRRDDRWTLDVHADAGVQAGGNDGSVEQSLYAHAWLLPIAVIVSECSSLQKLNARTTALGRNTRSFADHLYYPPAKLMSGANGPDSTTTSWIVPP